MKRRTIFHGAAPSTKALIAVLAATLLAGCAHPPEFRIETARLEIQRAYDAWPICVWLPDTMTADRSDPAFYPRIARTAEERASFRPFIEAGLLEEAAGQARTRPVPVWRYRLVGPASFETCFDDKGYPEVMFTGLPYVRREVVAVRPRAKYKARCGYWRAGFDVDSRLVDFAPWYDEARFGPHTNRRHSPAESGRIVTSEMSFWTSGPNRSWSTRNPFGPHSRNFGCDD